MAKLTNAQLAAENAALRMEINTLRDTANYATSTLMLANLRMAELEDHMTNLASVASAVNTMQQPTWRMEANARRAQMNAARDTAIQQRRMTIM